MKMKKLLAPIIITILIVLYFFGFVVACFVMDMPMIAKVLGALFPAGLICVSVFVLVERIHEVRSGEEDDLSNY